MPLFQIAGGSSMTVQPRQPAVVHLPADLISNLVAHENIVADVKVR